MMPQNLSLFEKRTGLFRCLKAASLFENKALPHCLMPQKHVRFSRPHQQINGLQIVAEAKKPCRLQASQEGRGRQAEERQRLQDATVDQAQHRPTLPQTGTLLSSTLLSPTTALLQSPPLSRSEEQQHHTRGSK